MRLSEIEFGSFLSYSPWGKSNEAMSSRTVRSQLKGDEPVGSRNIPMSDLIAQNIKRDLGTLPFTKFFNENTILVPTPNSSLRKSDSLWVPQRLARALVKEGLGKDSVECLSRITPIRKAATSPASERPKAEEHYDTMGIVKTLDEPNEILLVDDVVTRGATLLGAANKLADSFPNANIRAFAAMRTITNPNEFDKIIDPCTGIIELGSENNTFRNP